MKEIYFIKLISHTRNSLEILINNTIRSEGINYTLSYKLSLSLQSL